VKRAAFNFAASWAAWAFIRPAANPRRSRFTRSAPRRRHRHGALREIGSDSTLSRDAIWRPISDTVCVPAKQVFTRQWHDRVRRRRHSGQLFPPGNLSSPWRLKRTRRSHPFSGDGSALRDADRQAISGPGHRHGICGKARRITRAGSRSPHRLPDRGFRAGRAKSPTAAALNLSRCRRR